MIGPLTGALTNSGLTNLVQSTSSSVTTETVLKAIGRPGFILIDKKICCCKRVFISGNLSSGIHGSSSTGI